LSANKARFGTLARLVVTLGVAWLVFNRIDWTFVAGLLARAELVWLTLAGLVVAVQFAVMVWRWQIVIELLGERPAVAGVPLAIALGRSMLIGQLLPSTVGGDVVRTAALSRQIGLSLAARSVFCDRILALMVLFALVVVTLPFFALLVEAGPAFFAVAAVSLGGLAAFLVVIVRPRWWAAVPWLGDNAATLVGDLRQLVESGARGHLVLLLGLATHLFGILLTFALAHAVAAPISLVDCLLVVPPTLLISSVPISFGGWGIREGALAAGFVLVGMSSEAGVATSILFGLTGLSVGLITELTTPLLRMHVSRPKDAA
jgi:uncharacterized membrane protein YbhN (UPF0104 family)